MATPHFYINPTYSGLFPLCSKNFGTPQSDSIFDFIKGGREAGGRWVGEGVQLCFIFLITMYNKYVYTKHVQLLCREFPKATKKNMFMRDKQQYHYRFLLLVEPLCCLLLTAGARK